MPLKDIEDILAYPQFNSLSTKLYASRRLQQEATGRAGVRSAIYNYLGRGFSRVLTLNHGVAELESIPQSYAEPATTVALDYQAQLVDHLKSLSSATSPSPEAVNADINYMAFLQYKSDPTWFRQHIGCFVAFVDGALVGQGTDRQEFLSWLITSYPGRPKFFIRVEKEELIEHLPSPLDVSDI